jgi:ABC-type antimicrobial peptide transport system permease subunit
MFKNYLTVTLRYFAKHKLFSAINILCLSIGITFCLIISAYVLQQQSVNSKLKDVGISCLVAFPVAYYLVDKWLKIFTYTTGLRASPFLLSALVVLLITLLTVIFHTIKAAIANPVQSLRNE